MDLSTRNYINSLAERVIKVYNIAIPITNIDDVVRSIGGTVEEKRYFDDLCDGTIIKEGKDSFRIAISPHQNEQRTAFTVAHVLGHLFLHMGYRTNPDLWAEQDQTIFRRFGYSGQEYQANEFAAALLMPRDMYKRVLLDNAIDGHVDMSIVAKHFNVSQAAAVNRGKFLGYLA